MTSVLKTFITGYWIGHSPNRSGLGGICVLLAAGTWFGYQALGSDLLPQMDEGGFILDYFTPAGSSLAETNRILDHVERILHSMPEVESTSRRTGLELGYAAVTEGNRGDFTVRLKAQAHRSVWEVMDDVRAEIKKTEPELDIELTQILQDNINDLSNAPEPIQIKLYSSDQQMLAQLGSRVGDAIGKISRRGGRGERNREHDQRTGDQFPDQSELWLRGWALPRKRPHRTRRRSWMGFQFPLR
jgi:multidrug efflux pump subunit AcrB